MGSGISTPSPPIGQTAFGLYAGHLSSRDFWFIFMIMMMSLHKNTDTYTQTDTHTYTHIHLEPGTLNVPTAEGNDSGKFISSEHGNIFHGVSGLQIYEIRGHTSTGSCPKMQVLVRKDDEPSPSIPCDLVQGHTTQQSQQGA